MIFLSGKHLLTSQRAYALVCPETTEGSETEHFGFAESLADRLLAWQGWIKPSADLEETLSAIQRADPTFNLDLQRQRVRTPDEIHACIQALLNPQIDLWGYRLVEAQERVMRAAAWLLDLGDLLPYFAGDPRIARTLRAGMRGDRNEAFYEAESAFRTWIEWNVRDLGIQHILLDAMVAHDSDLNEPGLLAQIHRQLDEVG